MSSPSGLQALHEARDRAAAEIAAALQRITLPVGFRGRIVVVVDKGLIRAQDVTIELRPEQSSKT